jgi:Sulfotransferase family
MSKLVFLTGDFCSGSTLLFTLFRQTGQYHCLYEPLHPLLREYLIWPLRAYEHHYFVGDYFKEFSGFDRINELFDPSWATRDLYMETGASAPRLKRYLDYLIETGFQRHSRVLLKFNRMNFRLPWLRAQFPEAKIVHIYRDKDSEWKSILRRGQEHVGKEDIGQDSPHFEGFQIATWCEDLKRQFPELAAEASRTGYERFCKLYDRSLAAQQPYADISIEYRALCRNFDVEGRRMFDAVGCETDLAPLKALVVPPEKQKPLAAKQAGLMSGAGSLVERAGRKYARIRVSWYDRQRKQNATA